MNDPKDAVITSLIVVAIDMTRTLQAIGHRHHKLGKDLQEMWTTVSAINNGAIEADDRNTKRNVRLLCLGIKLAADAVSKHYKD